jgi:hypothetical protein
MPKENRREFEIERSLSCDNRYYRMYNLLMHIIAQQVVIKQFDVDYNVLEEYSLFGRDFFDLERHDERPRSLTSLCRIIFPDIFIFYSKSWKLKKILQLTSTICSCRLDTIFVMS